MIEFNITNGIERDCDEICCDCDVSIDDENGIEITFDEMNDDDDDDDDERETVTFLHP